MPTPPTSLFFLASTSLSLTYYFLLSALEVRSIEPRRAAESHATLVRWMGLMDANSAGFVHGGVVMRLCDEAAGLAAIKHSRQRVVTERHAT